MTRCLYVFLFFVTLVSMFVESVNAQLPDADQIVWLVKGAPDPAAIHAKDGSGNYIFATGEGIAIWRSQDLQSWKRTGRVFNDAVPAWAKAKIPQADSIWAPDIQFMNDKYYLYYSVSSFGSQRSVIGLATNPTLNPNDPKYRWEDKGLVIESSPLKNDYNAIDPAMFAVGDDAYLVWGSYWTGIKGTRIDPATGKPSSPQPVAVPLASRAPNGPTSIEAAYVIRHGYYFYLFVSWDFCCARENSTYKILVGRSRLPLGPYVDHTGRKMTEGGGKLVVMSDRRWRGPGHNSVLQVDDKYWLVHHAIDGEQPDLGRILQLRPLRWEEGWPVAGRPLGQKSSLKSKTELVGRWDHLVNNRDRYDIFFEPNGAITGVRGRSEWELRGRDLLMKWHDPNAPGGMWIDTVRLSESGTSYSGKNQAGISIEGRIR